MADKTINTLAKHPLFLLFFCFPLVVTSQVLQTVIQQGHPAAVTAVAFSPDGQLMATGSRDKTLKLWETSTGNEIRTFSGHGSEVMDLCFSPEGRYLLSSNWDKTVKVWDVVKGDLILDFTGHDKMVSAVITEPSGRLAVSAGTDKTAKLWNILTGEVIREFPVDAGQYGVHLDISPQGNYLATGNDDGVATVFHLKTGDTLRTVRELEYSSCGGCLTEVAFGPTENLLVTAADRGPLVVWDLKSGEIIKKLIEKQENYVAIDVSTDGKYVLAAWEEGLGVWEMGSYKKVSALEGFEKEINDAAFSPDGNFIMTGAIDNRAILWNRETGARLMEYKGIFSQLPDTGLDLDPEDYWQSFPYQNVQLKKQFEISPDGEYLVVGQQGFNLPFWSWKEGKKIKELKGHQKAVISFDFSPDHKYLVTGGGDKVAILWDAVSGDSIRSFGKHYYLIFDVQFSHDGTLLATAGYDGYARVWNVNTGEEITGIYLTGDRNTIDHPFSIGFTPNDRYIVTGSLGKKFTLWEIDSGEEFISFTGHTDVVSCIRFLPDGSSMLSGSWDHSIKQWDYRTGFLEKKFSGHTAAVNDFDLSSDGKKMVSGSTDRSIILWDLDSGTIIRKITGHSSSVTTVRFSKDEKYLLSESIDGVIKIWETGTGRELVTQFFVNSEEWLITNPNGYFYSQGNVNSYVHFVRGTATYNTEQFFEDFYRPELMQDLFQKDRSLLQGMNVDKKLDSSPPPEVVITFPENGKRINYADIDVLIKVTSRGDGISEVKLMHNGKRLPEDRAGLEKVMGDGKSIFQTYKVKLIPGFNTFHASAFSRGRVESKTAESTVHYEGKENPADCYVVAIGINKYKNQNLNLNYARADAEDFINRVKGNEGKLYSRVITHTFFDEQATKNNILQSLEEISGIADPSDVFFFYYAGHGSMVGQDFYFIPHECTRLYEEGALKQEALYAGTIQDLFSNIKALKQVVIMDACQSGGSVELLAQRGAASEKAIAQLSRSAGVHVMASAGSEQFATEYRELGHGIFTYVLLDALGGKADGAPADGKITIYELKSYLDSMVPDLSEKYKGKMQYPYTFSRGHDFPLSVQ